MDKKILQKAINEYEEWRPIQGFDYYEVSNRGRVRSKDKIVNAPYNSKATKKGKILSPCCRNGYLFVVLYGDKTMLQSVHRLVAMTFIGEIQKGFVINHKNGIRNDNRVENLEICTQSHNIKEAYRIGLQKPNLTNLGKFGELNKKAKKINQIDQNNNIVGTFYGTLEAERETGINFRNIHMCLKGKRIKAGGFHWEYSS